MKQKWESIETYECEYKTFQKKDNKKDTRTYYVYFKKPLWVRLKVLKGRNKGSEVMDNPEKNIVRGRRGGILRGIVLTLKPDDKKVVSIRGFKVYDAGISGIYIRFLKYFEEGFEMEYLGRFEEKGHKGLKIRIKIEKPGKYWGLCEEIIWFTDDYIPYKTEGFDEKGKKVLEATFYKVYLNTKIPENLWRLQDCYNFPAKMRRL